MLTLVCLWRLSQPSIAGAQLPMGILEGTPLDPNKQ